MEILTLHWGHPIHNPWTVGSLWHNKAITQCAREALVSLLEGTGQNADDAFISLDGYELTIYGVTFDNQKFFTEYERILDECYRVLKEKQINS